MPSTSVEGPQPDASEPSPQEPPPNPECTTYARTFAEVLALGLPTEVTRSSFPHQIRERASALRRAASAPTSDILAGAFAEQSALASELAGILLELGDAIDARNEKSYLIHRDRAEALIGRQAEVDRKVSSVCGWPLHDDPDPHRRAIRDGRRFGTIGMLGDGTSSGSVGRIPPHVIQKVVRTEFHRFRPCYEEGLTRNPDLEGKVTIRFVIGLDGRVSDAVALGQPPSSEEDRATADFLRRVNGASPQSTILPGTTLPDSRVVDCMLTVYRSLVFPKPKDGEVTVVYPISFSPG